MLIVSRFRITLLLMTFLAIFTWFGRAQAQDSLLVNIEIDYMVKDGYAYIPTQFQVDQLVNVFACEGITLNIVLDDTIHYVHVYSDHTVDSLQAIYDDHPGEIQWKWCLIGVTSSTRSFGGGRRFFTTGGVQPNTQPPLGTFMHELGHTIGLGHHAMYAPNFPSVMNYRYLGGRIAAQIACDGLASECPSSFRMLDYSHGTLLTLREGDLYEPEGMGLGPVDWNCNGVIDSTRYSYNLRRRTRCSPAVLGPGLVANDKDEWSVVRSVIAGYNSDPQVDHGDTVTVHCDGLEDLEKTATESYADPTYPMCMLFYGDFAGQSCDSIWGRDIDSDGVYDFCDDCPFLPDSACCCRLPGDADLSGIVSVSDISTIINYIFGGGTLECYDAADANGSGFVSIGDAVRVANFVYTGGPVFPVCGTRGL